MSLTSVQTISTIKATHSLENAPTAGQALVAEQLNAGTRTYTSGTSPAATAYHGSLVEFPGTGTGAAADVVVDLTALEDIEGNAITATGLSVVEVRLQRSAATENDSTVTVAPGDTNGYALFGAGNSISLEPGDSIHARLLSSPSIGASCKNIKFSGDAGSSVSVEFILG
jgi:hypothetical protein